jgi:hypothetical protein
MGTDRSVQRPGDHPKMENKSLPEYEPEATWAHTWRRLLVDYRWCITEGILLSDTSSDDFRGGVLVRLH